MKRVLIVFAIAALLPSFLLCADAQNLKVRVIASAANLRSAPDINAAVIQTAKAGTVFSVIRVSGDWYLISLASGGQAYINRTVVEEVTEPAAAPTEPAPPVRKPAAPEPAPQTSQAPSIQTQAEEPRFYVRAGYDMGFQEPSQTLDFTRTVYYETASFGLAYKAKKSGSIDAAAGYMFSRSLGVEIGASMTNRDLTETLSLSVPHPLWMGYPRTGTMDASGLKISEIDVYLNLVFNLRFSMFGVSLYGGPCLIMATATIVSNVTTAETGYPYMEMAADQTTSNIKKNVTGFDAGAALSVYLGRSFALVLDVRYVGGTGAFKPEGDIPELKLALGGLRAGGGLKVRF